MGWGQHTFKRREIQNKYLYDILSICTFFNMHQTCHVTYMKHACHLPVICLLLLLHALCMLPLFWHAYNMHFAPSVTCMLSWHALHMNITFMLQACLGQHACYMHKISCRVRFVYGSILDCTRVLASTGIRGHRSPADRQDWVHPWDTCGKLLICTVTIGV